MGSFWWEIGAVGLAGLGGVGWGAFWQVRTLAAPDRASIELRRSMAELDQLRATAVAEIDLTEIAGALPAAEPKEHR